MQADSLCYQTDKQLKEFADKVPAEVKSKVEEKIASLRAAVDSEDLEAMKSGIDELNKVSFCMLLLSSTMTYIRHPSHVLLRLC